LGKKEGENKHYNQVGYSKEISEKIMTISFFTNYISKELQKQILK
jgi:hypothetical protein